MTEDVYIVAIAALLPLTTCMLVFQVNPYHALVMRGILGAVAALTYALFGAADVALTEALVGTMLSITLYAVAVRSSLIMRVGILASESNANPTIGFPEAESTPPGKTKTSAPTHPNEKLLSALRKMLKKYHMRLELVTYPDSQTLQTALLAKEIHTTSILAEQQTAAETPQSSDNEQPLYHIQTRIQRLYDIMQAELSPKLANLTYFNTTNP